MERTADSKLTRGLLLWSLHVCFVRSCQQTRKVRDDVPAVCCEFLVKSKPGWTRRSFVEDVRAFSLTKAEVSHAQLVTRMVHIGDHIGGYNNETTCCFRLHPRSHFVVVSSRACIGLPSCKIPLR